MLITEAAHTSQSPIVARDTKFCWIVTLDLPTLSYNRKYDVPMVVLSGYLSASFQEYYDIKNVNI